MTKIVGIRFRNVGKIYYFDPKNYKMQIGDHVIVETARGIEFGRVVLGPKEVGEGSSTSAERSPQSCDRSRRRKRKTESSERKRRV